MAKDEPWMCHLCLIWQLAVLIFSRLLRYITHDKVTFSPDTEAWHFEDGIKCVNMSWLISQNVITPHCATWSRLIVTIVGATHIFGQQRKYGETTPYPMTYKWAQPSWGLSEMSPPSHSPKLNIPQLALHTFGFRPLRLYCLQKCRCHRGKAIHLHQSFPQCFSRRDDRIACTRT